MATARITARDNKIIKTITTKLEIILTTFNRPSVLWLLHGSLFTSTASVPFTPPASDDRNGLFAADAELSTTSSRSSMTSSLGVADAVEDSRRSANGFVGGSAAVYVKNRNRNKNNKTFVDIRLCPGIATPLVVVG